MSPVSPEPALDLDAASPVLWDGSGLPRSRFYDDVYFSSADGLAESRAVFLHGCGLPEAWAGRGRFVVGELGFGSGLNIAALLALWRETHEPGARLNIFSIEAHPMPAADAGRVLGAWPELAEVAAPLLARWPGRARGFHRVDLPEFDATLDLAIMDAAAALEAWSGAADAWFLDGFSPAANPAMWSAEVLGGVARRSAPGARAATFTVAGAVRRELAAQGFEVEKRPGFGRKRERLEARWPGAPAPGVAAPAPGVVIIGAGVAGLALARAFVAEGLRPLVIDADGACAGASGNAAALVMPRLDAGGGEVAQLHAQAFARAARLYGEIPAAVISRGAVQVEVGPKDPDRFDRIAQSDLFEPGAVSRLSAEAVGARRGRPSDVGGLAFGQAMVVEPASVASAWLEGCDRLDRAVARLAFEDGDWSLFDADDWLIIRARIVCLAAGAAVSRLAPDTPVAPVRGQVSVIDVDEQVGAPEAVIGGGYVIATREGLLFGATHDRDEIDTAVRDADHARNLALVAGLDPRIAVLAAAAPLEGRAGLRAATPDFLPLAGAAWGAPAGLFILSGLGSRGFCTAPLLAEHVAALAFGAPSPLPRALARIVDPARFERRRLRKGRPAPSG
jgi:tRNA 5-methylaminomethyl-2-thiouridine biosynthesis bifunctional protein